MTVIGHVGGVPLEEMLPALTSGLLLAPAWLMLHLRRRRESGARRFESD